MTDKFEKKCNECSHYREPIPLTRSSEFKEVCDIDTLRKFSNYENKIKEREETYLKHIIAESKNNKWPQKPKYLPYCSLKEANGIYYIAQCINPNQQCRFFSKHIKNKSCFDCRFLDNPRKLTSAVLQEKASDNFQNTLDFALKTVDVDINAVPIRQLRTAAYTKKSMNRFSNWEHENKSKKECKEAIQLGYITEYPYFFKWCRKYSNSETYHIAIICNPDCKCPKWQKNDTQLFDSWISKDTKNEFAINIDSKTPLKDAIIATLGIIMHDVFLCDSWMIRDGIDNSIGIDSLNSSISTLINEQSKYYQFKDERIATLTKLGDKVMIPVHEELELIRSFDANAVSLCVSIQKKIDLLQKNVFYGIENNPNVQFISEVISRQMFAQTAWNKKELLSAYGTMIKNSVNGNAVEYKTNIVPAINVLILIQIFFAWLRKSIYQLYASYRWEGCSNHYLEMNKARQGTRIPSDPKCSEVIELGRKNKIDNYRRDVNDFRFNLEIALCCTDFLIPISKHFIDDIEFSNDPSSYRTYLQKALSNYTEWK